MISRDFVITNDGSINHGLTSWDNDIPTNKIPIDIRINEYIFVCDKLKWFTFFGYFMGWHASMIKAWVEDLESMDLESMIKASI